MTEKLVFVRERVTLWEKALRGASSLPAWMGDGFCPVFNTLEKFKEAYPDEEPAEAIVLVKEQS